MTTPKGYSLTEQIAEQMENRSRCGGDLDGYIARYDVPGHQGEGGAAIYAADTRALLVLLRRALTARKLPSPYAHRWAVEGDALVRLFLVVVRPEPIG